MKTGRTIQEIGAEILRQGGSAQEVEEDMLRTVPKLSTHFVVDTLQYLHMGGRCSSIAYLAGSVLKLHPQINMVDGAMIAGEKFRGKLDHIEPDRSGWRWSRLRARRGPRQSSGARGSPPPGARRAPASGCG